jgi:ectoine hydroxylase-related dioxygenase (phytanoyl-CoA dioxygenase family)
VDAPLRLSEAQIARYKDQGYVLLGRIADVGEVRALLAEERRFRLPFAYGGKQNPTLLVRPQLCHLSEPVRRFAIAGRHVPMVVQLLGPDVCFTHQQYIAKLPDAPDTHSDIPWHQDNGYGTLEPMTDVTVWLALHDTDESNGCVWVLPGSHRLGLLPHDQASINPFLREAKVEGEPIPARLRAGEAIAFSGLLLHGSGPNRTDRERVGMFVRYCEPHVRMVTEGDRPVLDDAHSWMVAGEARAAGK